MNNFLDSLIIGEDNFEHIEDWVKPIPTAEEAAREWRDMELLATDYIVPLSDHPQRDAYMTYRVSLREWPSTEDFPEVKPLM
jgi:hypothetical protein